EPGDGVVVPAGCEFGQGREGGEFVVDRDTGPAADRAQGFGACGQTAAVEGPVAAVVLDPAVHLARGDEPVGQARGEGVAGAVRVGVVGGRDGPEGGVLFEPGDEGGQ